MDRATTEAIWELLDQQLRRLEGPKPQQPGLARQAQAALAMLLECDPAEVLRCAQASRLPARALVSWLAHEGRRLGMAGQADALETQWRREHGGQAGLIAAPANTNVDPKAIMV